MISNSQANKILDRYFGNVSDTVTTNLYIGLSTTAINADGTGATEPSGGNYARVLIANNKVSWGNASNAVLSNLIEVSFPESTTSWGTITHIFLANAISGQPIYFDALATPRQVQAQTTLIFATGTIQIRMTSV